MNLDTDDYLNYKMGGKQWDCQWVVKEWRERVLNKIKSLSHVTGMVYDSKYTITHDFFYEVLDGEDWTFQIEKKVMVDNTLSEWDIRVYSEDFMFDSLEEMLEGLLEIMHQIHEEDLLFLERERTIWNKYLKEKAENPSLFY